MGPQKQPLHVCNAAASLWCSSLLPDLHPQLTAVSRWGLVVRMRVWARHSEGGKVMQHEG